MTVEVTFSPVEPDLHSGTLHIQSNDPDTDELVVSLCGLGVLQPEPEIAVAPEALDFGVLNTGVERILEVTVQNTGEQFVVISTVSLGPNTPAAFELVNESFGFTIDPGMTATVAVGYTPTEADTIPARCS